MKASHIQSSASSAAEALVTAIRGLASANPGGFVVDHGAGVHGYSTNVPMVTLNGITIDRTAYLPISDLHGEQLVSRLRGSGVPWSIQCYGVGPEPDLSCFGVVNGQGRPTPTWTLDLSQDARKPVPAGLTFVSVHTDTERAAYAEILAEAFGGDLAVGQTLAATAGLRGSAHVAYLGFFDGQAVVTGSSVIDGMWGGVFSIATKSSWRRRGFAEAMTGHMTSAAKEAGATSAYLQASDMALPIYRRMGFIDSGDEITYYYLD